MRCLGYKWWDFLPMHICPKKVWESNIILWCNTIFDHIWICFPHIFDPTQSWHDFLLWSLCAMSITTFINKVFEHSDSLLTITCTTWMCYIFCLLCHIWSMKMIVTSQSQSLLLCKITPNTIIGFILMYSLCYQIILTLSMGGWSNTVPPSLSI